MYLAIEITSMLAIGTEMELKDIIFKNVFLTTMDATWKANNKQEIKFVNTIRNFNHLRLGDFLFVFKELVIFLNMIINIYARIFTNDVLRQLTTIYR
jgi:hypothetical protein